MRIAVFGTGAVGGYFGGRLAQAGEDVVFIARGDHLQAMLTHGLKVESIKGDFTVNPVQATEDPAEVGIVDVVLMGVKTWQVPEAAEAARPMVGPETLVLPLQNGLEAQEQLAAVLGEGHALGGLCGIFCHVAGPGHIRHGGLEPFVKFGEIGRPPGRRVEELREAFVRAGVTAEIPPDIQVALWMKFLFVTTVSGVGGVTRTPAGVWRNLPETRQMAEQGLQEILAVSRARDISLPEDAAQTTMAMIDSLVPQSISSMHRDVVEGRPSELEAQIGAVVRFGKEAEVATPLHDFIYHSLLPLELRARGKLKFPE